MKEILLGILGMFWCIFLGIFGIFYGILVIILTFKFIVYIKGLFEDSLKELIGLFKRTLSAIHFCTKKSCDFIVEQNKMRKVLTIIMVVLMSLAIIGILYDAFMPSVMKYPHNLVQSFSSDVIENESNVLRRNINDTVGNVNIDIKQSNENVGKKEDYIKKEYLDSATYSYNVVNTISGILTPLFSLLTVIVAFVTLYRQRKQNAIQNFENHLFQMIEQQHKLEEKVVNKHDSFMDLYENFCDIYRDVWKFVKDNSRIIDERNIKEISLKISNYIFYFGADQDLICDKTYKRLIEQYGLEEEKLKSLINELNNKLYEKYMGKKLKKEKNDRYCILFCTQKSEELGIYYRNLFNAIRYIDWECPDGDKKEFYAKLVRTNLSDFAQLMLYYNMQGERGSAWLDKDEVKDPKGDQDGYYYSKNKKDGKPVRVKDCLLTRYLPIKNCAISVKNKDIDPRKDGRTDLFSDDVIHYELKY